MQREIEQRGDLKENIQSVIEIFTILSYAARERDQKEFKSVNKTDKVC